MIKNTTRKTKLLQGTGIVMLVSLGATSAYAASTIVTDNASADVGFASTTSGYQSVQSTPTNTDTVYAEILNATGGITRVGTSTGSSDSVTANTIAASATGNNFVNPLSSLLLDSDATVGGLATLGVAINTGNTFDIAIASVVGNNALTVSNTGITSGSVTNSDNAISATTTINNGSSLVSGQVPNTYADSTVVTSFLDAFADTEAEFTDDLANVSGSIVVTTVQVASGGDSYATAESNDVTLSLLSTVGQSVTASASLDDNVVSAAFIGNNGTGSVDLSGGENPNFQGTVAVANVQLYSGNSSEAGEGERVQSLNTNTSVAARVVGDDVNEGTDYFVNTLLGSGLSVVGNSVTSSADGNVSLANGISVDGLNVSSVMTDASASLDNFGSFDLFSQGGLNVTSLQRVALSATFDDASITSQTSNAAITAYVQNLDDSSIMLTDSTISSTSRGNNYSSVIESVTPITTLASSVNAAAMQSLDGIDINANTTNTVIGATAGDNLSGGIYQSSISVLDNTVSASAYGSQLDQSVALDGTTLTLGTGQANLFAEAGTDQFGNVNGEVLVSSLQTSFSSNVNASNTGSLIQIVAQDDEGTDGSTLLASGNRQEAVALGMLADNGLSLNGTTVGTGAGILTMQAFDRLSSVSASFSGVGRIVVSEDVGEAETDEASSVSLVGNLQRAVAYGASSVNALNVGATTVETLESASFQVSTSTNVNAGFGILNAQTVDGAVSANTATTDAGAFLIDIGLDVDSGSSVRNDSNTVLAAAYGTSAASDAVLDLGTLSVLNFGEGGVDNYSAIANVTNDQLVNAAITARVSLSGSALFTTDVEDDVFDGSSVSTSSNVMQAQALGNNAISNSLSVDGTSLNVFAGSTGTDAGIVTLASGTVVNTDAAFSVVNTQFSASSTVLASLRNFSPTADFDAADVLTRIGDDLRDSSVVSLANQALATAVGNKASNALDISATTLRTTGALANLQTGGADVFALIGREGTAAVAATPAASYDNGGSGTYNLAAYSSLTDDLTIVDGGSVTIDISSTPIGDARTTLISLLEGAGFTVTGTTATNSTAGVYDLSFFTTFSQAGADSGTISFTGFSSTGTLGSDGTPTLGGVTIAIGDTISNSIVQVANNRAIGSAFGNSASNLVTVSATGIAADGTNAVSGGTETTASVSGLQFAADYQLANLQSLDVNSSSTSEVYGTFAIDKGTDSAITQSTVDVSGNAQSSTAVGNVGVNALTVAATDMATSPSSALLTSTQSDLGSVTVDAGMVVFAPAASLNSSIALNDNSNSALGVINDVSNTLTVSATNLGSGNDINALLGSTIDAADSLLANFQISGGTLTSTASTAVYNQDLTDDATGGIVTSSVTMDGNATSAEASANRAINVATVSGSASQGGTVALSNEQTSSTVVAANAASSITASLIGTFVAGTPDTNLAALNAGSVSINGNTTTSLARGNSATNTLTSAATANYVPLSGATTSGSVGGVVDASAVVLNNQNNSGNVSARSDSATYAAVLNNAAGTAVTASSVSVASNRVDATAFGNTATNRLTLTALNTGLATGAVNNVQFNSGNITAAVQSVAFTINISGGTTGSSFTAGRNAITATAVGNNAVSTIASVGR